jgi:hypothetical protein
MRKLFKAEQNKNGAEARSFVLLQPQKIKLKERMKNANAEKQSYGYSDFDALHNFNVSLNDTTTKRQRTNGSKPVSYILFHLRFT